MGKSRCKCGPFLIEKNDSDKGTKITEWQSQDLENYSQRAKLGSKQQHSLPPEPERCRKGICFQYLIQYAIIIQKK